MRYKIGILVLLSSILSSCATKKITDVSYLVASKENTIEEPKLNVFIPRNSKAKSLPVLIFVHGGYWNSGSKGTYDLLGRNFARKDVVTVIPDYTLSPNTDYDGMTKQIAAVIQWTKDSISKYKGNPNQVFVTGHSAGGHLAALAVMNPKYGIKPSGISGIILNDAAGLDMKHYLEENPPTAEHDYLTTWGSSPAKWQDASPIYFLDKNTPPFLIYVGDKTYTSIKVTNKRFIDALYPFQPEVTAVILNKKHVPMITQYFWPYNNRFNEVIDFMKSQQK
ncbi:alpha/beta hydrolase [Flavobacterium sp. XN-5]|uniref:alpha/beta hydrolase n=1 Tax=Flavobacterium sp. XN-5 TaxID=2599390 RepID=UPI0011C72487|nr:alpha/beta hydrolase [Flavobacterium sp. XN-5]NGY38521.1 alpha/beta hydrolase [Flavobacterium sp. XN-5]